MLQNGVGIGRVGVAHPFLPCRNAIVVAVEGVVAGSQSMVGEPPNRCSIRRQAVVGCPEPGKRQVVGQGDLDVCAGAAGWVVAGHAPPIQDILRSSLHDDRVGDREGEVVAIGIGMGSNLWIGLAKGGGHHDLARQRVVGRHNQVVEGGGNPLVHRTGESAEAVRGGRHGEPASTGASGTIVGGPGRWMGEKDAVQANLEVAPVVYCIRGLVVELKGQANPFPGLDGCVADHAPKVGTCGQVVVPYGGMAIQVESNRSLPVGQTGCSGGQQPVDGQHHAVRPDNLVGGHVELVGYRPAHPQLEHLGMICRDRIAAGLAIGFERSDQIGTGRDHRVAGGTGGPSVRSRHREPVGIGFERLPIVQRIGRGYRQGGGKQTKYSRHMDSSIHNNLRDSDAATGA